MFESKLPAGVGAVDDEVFPVGEDSFIAVGGDVPQDQYVARADMLPVQSGIGRRGTAHVRHGSLPADQLGNCVGDLRGIALETCPLGRKAGQFVRIGGHSIASGVITPDDRQDTN